MLPKPPKAKHLPSPKSNRLPKRKPVTFILGLKCNDGLVLCSDSLEADGVIKKNVKKLFNYENPGEWGVAFGCSGSSAACSNFGDRLLEHLQSEKAFNRRSMEKTIEAHIQYFSKEYPAEKLQMVIGVYNTKPSEIRLYGAHTDTECLSVQSDYACAGMDVSLARFLLDSIFTDDVTVEDGMYLASFIMHVMKEKADGVGGPTQLLHFRVDHPHWFAPNKKSVGMFEKGGFIEGKFHFKDLEKKIRQFCWSRFPHKFRPAKE
jgi:20S proteasome alpha/beta subunit